MADRAQLNLLKQGVKAWSAWGVGAGKDTRIYLHGANVREADLDAWTVTCSYRSKRRPLRKQMSIAVSVICVIGIMFAGASKIAGAVAWRSPYYCFFDPGSAKLNDRCNQILLLAAAALIE